MNAILSDMLRAQSDLNDVFDPQWRVNRHNYMRASAIEAVEMIVHHGYKWWKGETCDFPQMQLEMIDIMHFIISEISRRNDDPASEEQELHKAWALEEPVIRFDDKDYVLDEMQPLELMDLFAAMMFVQRFSFTLFRKLMKYTGIDIERLQKTYFSKCVLNLFRQHNGYKDQTYVKIWSGREDNEVLYDLMDSWKLEEGSKVLYERLEDCYKVLALGEA
ncbi:dUTP diphosphatase [Pseudomonas aeruginosa]